MIISRVKIKNFTIVLRNCVPGDWEMDLKIPDIY